MQFIIQIPSDFFRFIAPLGRTILPTSHEVACRMKRLLAILIIVCVLWCVAKAVPLKTEYPKPVFGFGPIPIQLPNLEPPHDNKEWSFDLPEGCTNLARGRPAISNDPHVAAEELTKITDGEKSGLKVGEDGAYQWYGSIVQLAAGPRWVQIDLGKKADIYAVLVWHNHIRPCPYKAVIVQLSDDATFSNGVSTVFNSDIGNLNGQGIGKDFCYIENNYGKLIDAKGAQARYLRFWSNGNTEDSLNRYMEIEVWGK